MGHLEKKCRGHLENKCRSEMPRRSLRGGPPRIHGFERASPGECIGLCRFRAQGQRGQWQEVGCCRREQCMWSNQYRRPHTLQLRLETICNGRFTLTALPENSLLWQAWGQQNSKLGEGEIELPSNSTSSLECRVHETGVGNMTSTLQAKSMRNM